MTRVIKAQPPDLTKIEFDAGPRVVVFVEGLDDQYAFRQWFVDRLSEVQFYECGGVRQTEKLLKEFLSQSSLKRGYAIIDRDFRAEEEVEESRKPDSHCFVLRRYSLENYLVEVEPIREELEVVTAVKPTTEEIEKRLLELCQKLKTICAIQWLCWEKRVDYLPDGFEIEPRQMLIEKSAKEFSCNLAEAESLVAEKEILIEQKLNDLNLAHQVISGKRLFHQAYLKLGFSKDGEDVFRRRLVKWVKIIGLPEDLKEIVQNRILEAG